jgi:hypothetical protein
MINKVFNQNPTRYKHGKSCCPFIGQHTAIEWHIWRHIATNNILHQSLSSNKWYIENTFDKIFKYSLYTYILTRIELTISTINHNNANPEI